GGGGTTDATADDGHTQRARAYGHHRASLQGALAFGPLCPQRPPACNKDCRVLAMGSAPRARNVPRTAAPSLGLRWMSAASASSGLRCNHRSISSRVILSSQVSAPSLTARS